MSTIDTLRLLAALERKPKHLSPAAARQQPGTLGEQLVAIQLYLNLPVELRRRRPAWEVCLDAACEHRRHYLPERRRA